MMGQIRRVYGHYAYTLPFFFCLYAVLYFRPHLFFISSIECTVTGASQEAIQEITQCLAQIKNCSAPYIMQTILERFSWIDTITVQRTVNQMLFCDASVKPILYTINNTHFLALDGKLYDISFFDQSWTTTKKSFVDERFLTKHKPFLLPVLNNIDTAIFDTYTVAIRNTYEATLTPHTDSRYLVFFTPFQKIDTQLLTAAVNQLNQLTAENSSRTKQKDLWIIDMRFANQLIFYKDKRGNV
jgi:hypothetical protein